MNGRALALALAPLMLTGVWLVAVSQPWSAPGKAQTFPQYEEAAPAAPSDEALRRTIARAIYGHPTFWREAALPEPPIQIVVHDGHVTLTGVVAGELERALACSLARGHGEASVTSRLRTRTPLVN